MKAWLMFIGGLLAGVAGGLLVGADRERARLEAEDGDSGRNGSEWRTGAGDGGSRSDGERLGTRSGGRRGGGTGPTAVEDLLLFLGEMAEVDDLEEINLLELLRHGQFVTTMRESEVVSLLAGFREEVAGSDDEENEMKMIFQVLLFARLAELNGPEAMRMAVAGELPRWMTEEVDVVVAFGTNSWVGVDPEGAAAWFRAAGGQDAALRELVADRDVQQAFFAAMARHDAQAAMDLVREVGAENVGANMETVARYEKSMEGLERILAATDGEGEARHDVFGVMVERDPDAAARWLAERATLEGRDQYLETVGSAMMARDLNGGIAWYMAQEVSPEGEAGRYRHVIDHLASDDPTTASGWLADQPDAPNRDEAEASLAMRLVYHDNPAEGFRWVREIGQPVMQRETLDQILNGGWDRDERRMDPDLERAAREAGFGGQVEEFIDKKVGPNPNEDQ